MENDDTHLLDKTYIPYQEKGSILSSDLALRLLSELGKSWIINVDGQLYKEYYFDNFIVGGSSGLFDPDKDGPEIKAWLNDEKFVNASIVNQKPILILKLRNQINYL